MKPFYISLIALLAITANAQIVTIPDAAFKSMLLNYHPTIDTNSDGEIQVNEALAVTALSLDYEANINDVTGIRAFSNLTSLTLGDMAYVTTIDVHDMTNLESLQLSYNSNVSSINISGLLNLHALVANSMNALTIINNTGTNNVTTLNLTDLYSLTSFDFSGMTQLQSLTCRGLYAMPTVNLAGLTNLHNLELQGYGFTSFNPSGLTALTDFVCDETAITTLDFSGNANLKNLTIRPNQSLTSLNLNGLAQLETVKCELVNTISVLLLSGNTNLTSLECGGNLLTSLSLAGSPNLTHLDCSHNELTNLNLAGLTALTYLACDTNHISSLNVSALNNLIHLSCADNLLTSLNVNMLTTLNYLSCGNNALGLLDVTALTNLTNLSFSNIGVSAVNLSTLHNLEELGTDGNSLGTLDVSGMPNLTSLNCGNNNLTTIDVSTLSHLTQFSCYENQLTAMHLNPNNLYNLLSCGNNPFTTLDLSDYHISNLLIDNCQNLTYLNLKGNQAILSISDCPNLTYICADEASIPSIMIALNWSETVQVNSYCTFTPGGNYNTIKGKFTLDRDNNGCDVNDLAMRSVRVGINDGIENGATFTNPSGNYTFYTQSGNFVLTPVFENPYFSISPAAPILNFASVDNSVQIQDFCVLPLGIHNDVEITLLPIGNPRPGFDVDYYLQYYNKGNQIQSGTISFTYNDSILHLIAAEPIVTSQSANGLQWTYTNLQPFESGGIHILLHLNAPTEIPAVNIDDVLNFSATIDPISGDETPSDNVSSISQTTTGSFDPNDKICLEGSNMTPERIGDYLHYIIHFQNSGTAPAENIVVKDVIDTSKFDISSLQLIGSSHPQTTKITGNKVEFLFENINLPAASTDEPESHGYVAFKIKTKNNLVLNDAVSNTADIYFDYNFPITTNTATTTVALLATDAFEDKSVSIFPNPVKDKLHITAKHNITSIQLYDLVGRLIETSGANGTEAIFNIGKNASGIYFVKIYTAKGVKVEKIIKQ